MTWTGRRGGCSSLLAAVGVLAACGGGGGDGTHGSASSDDASTKDLEGAASLDAQGPPGERDAVPDDGVDVAAEASADGTSSSCDDLARRVCEAIQTCAPFWLATNFGDANTCVGSMSASCAHYESSGNPLDEAGCTQALAAPNCHAVLGADFETGGVPEVCLRPRGMGAAGASCGSFSQCQSLHCDVPAGSVCGKCLGESHEDEACGSTAVCRPDLVCNGTTCVTPVAPGAPCTGSDVRCPGGTFCKNGVCQSYGTLGASCDATARCDNAHGLACKGSTCATVAIAMENQPCAPASFASCAGGLWCWASTCVAGHGLGEGCGADAGTGCDIPYWCNAGVCSYVPGAASCP